MNNTYKDIPFHKILFDNYERYYQQSLSSGRVVYEDIINQLERIKNNSSINIEQIGKSIEGRYVNLVSVGNGGKKILAWTQMHGDEPTATSAVFDVLNFFLANDEFDNFRNDLKSKVTLHIIPMLNPDGAEIYTRENSIGIDINRDALRQAAPESQILWNTAKKIKPEFGFNLHDQSNYYTAGKNNKSTAISLLAPPFNYAKSIDEIRLKSMKVIDKIYEVLSDFIPGQIARYNDEFEPRAFGDNFTKSGISSILIESGYVKNDQDKSLIRKLNFVAILSALDSIASESYKNEMLSNYSAIPENETLLFDLLLRNLEMNYNSRNYKIDIGINRKRFFDRENKLFYYEASIEEVGDLSIYSGIEEYNFENYNVDTAKTAEELFDLESLTEEMINNFHEHGIAYIKTDGNYNAKKYSELPINFIDAKRNLSASIKAGEPANLIISKSKKFFYIVVNGFLYNLEENKKSIHNGMVIP